MLKKLAGRKKARKIAKTLGRSEGALRQHALIRHISLRVS
jgi:hypothetical protein